MQGVGDDLLDRLDVPARAQLRHELPHLLHLVVVGAADEVDELGVRRPQHRSARDQAARLELAAEGQRARLRDDRLVEVEERCRRSGHRAHVLQCRQRAGLPHEMGRFASTAHLGGRVVHRLDRHRSRATTLPPQHRAMDAPRDATAPLLISADPLLVADVQRLSAAAGRGARRGARPCRGAASVERCLRRAGGLGLCRHPGQRQPAAARAGVRAGPLARSVTRCSARRWGSAPSRSPACPSRRPGWSSCSPTSVTAARRRV